MSYILRVYCENRLYSVDLTGSDNVTIGDTNSHTLKIDNCDLRKNKITINKSGNYYCIKAKGMYDRNGLPLSSDMISVEKTYIIDSEPGIHIAVHPRQNDSNETIPLAGIDELYLGRNYENDIILKNKRTSSKHCKIYQASGLIKIRDLGSSNGTYVNGKRISEKTLTDGDIINISVYEIHFVNNSLVFRNDGTELEINFDINEIPQNFKSQMYGDDTNSSNGTISMFGDNTSPAKGTVSMFDSDNNRETQSNQQIKNGTISIFDIDN